MNFDLENLLSRKAELEKNIRVDVFLKLVEKYNKYYSHKPECAEAILLETLILKLQTFTEVTEYVFCVENLFAFSESSDVCSKIHVMKVKKMK